MSKDKDITHINLNLEENTQKLLSIIHHFDNKRTNEILNEVSAILEDGVNLEVTNDGGNNALQVAISRSSNFHRQAYNIIMQYAKENCKDQIKEIINHRNSDQRTLLQLMILDNWPKQEVQELLDLGAIPDLKFSDYNSKSHANILEYLDSHPNSEYNGIDFENYVIKISLKSILLPLNPVTSLPKFAERENDRKSSNNQFKSVRA